MATVSSPGLGSGLDVTTIVEQLVAIERRPIELLGQQKTKLESTLSAFGLLQSYTVNVQDAVAKLAQPSHWQQTKATSSDTTAVTVSSSASAASGRYSLDVTQLAQAQALASTAYTSATAPTGTGSLSFQLGSWNADNTVFTPKVGATAVSVAIGAGQGTLAGVRDRINAAGAGVSASIITDATGARLAIRSVETGEVNAVRITATPDAPLQPGDPTLASLAYDPPAGATAITQTLVARNATAVVNGLPIVSASNVLSNVVDGLTLTLAKVTTASVQVNVGVDSAAMTTAVQDFVKAYNDINKYVAEQTKYDADKKVGGTLQGDRSTISLQNQLRAAITGTSGASSTFPRLSDIGLQVQRDGSLTLNTSKLADAINGNLVELGRAFTNVDTALPNNNGFAVRIKNLATALTNTDGLVSTRAKGLRDTINRNDKQQAVYEDRVASTRARLLRQYSALDTTLNKLTGLNSYVSQQIAAWNKTSN